MNFLGYLGAAIALMFVLALAMAIGNAASQMFGASIGG